MQIETIKIVTSLVLSLQYYFPRDDDVDDVDDADDISRKTLNKYLF